ncbi:MAG TPA: hypothetical protein VM029_07415 [Opitutaceae bacterium]|nr:hypothetical protein [Opitutaceae bacterium]
MLCARTVLLLLGLIGLMGGGCGTPAASRPVGLTPVVLEETTRRATINTRLGMEVRLDLPRPREPGNVWQIIQNDTRLLKPLSDVGAPASDSGRSRVRFHAVRLGRAQLKFLALPAGAAVADPVDFYDVIVVIQ